MAGEILFSQQLETIAAAGTVSRADVFALQNAIVPLAAITEQDAALLMKINRGKKADAALWDNFYIETLTEHVICDREPIGYVTHDDAEWLIAQISKKGIVGRLNDMELLLSVLDKGVCVPASLSAFALQQVAHAIDTGKGILRSRSEKGQKGFVSAADAAWIKRILLAFGNFGKVALSREEAEILFTISDLATAEENSAEWYDVYNAALANLILASSGYAVPERTVALSDNAHLQITEEVANSLVRQLSDIAGCYHSVDKSERETVRNTSWLEEHDNRVVSRSEADWLAERLARHGEINENERAILRFLSTQSASIHPALQELVEKQAA